MKILKSGVEMTPEELISSKAGNACACACQEGFDTAQVHVDGSEENGCSCGCIWGPFSGSATSARTYPY